MPLKCIEPKIGCLHFKFVHDSNPENYGKRKLIPIQFLSYVEHLVQCEFCRRLLNEDGKVALFTQLIMWGIFAEPEEQKSRKESMMKLLLSDDPKEIARIQEERKISLTMEENRKATQLVWVDKKTKGK